MLSFGNVQVLDFSSLVAIVAAWGVVPTVLTFLRRAFLDRLLQGFSADEQNKLLQGALAVLTMAGVLVVALASGHVLNWQTVLSVVVSTVVSGSLSHFSYNFVQKPPRVVYAEIPPQYNPPASSALSPSASLAKKPTKAA